MHAFFQNYFSAIRGGPLCRSCFSGMKSISFESQKLSCQYYNVWHQGYQPDFFPERKKEGMT